jgi:prepilin signal peptidase PulO-like enzyme (type II secretory pathway)
VRVALSFRSRVEHASYPLLERLNRVPRPVAVAVLVVLLLVGLFAPRPWGGIAFLAVAAVLAWFLYLTWQRLTLPERLMRLAVLLLTTAVAVVRLVPS